MTCRRLQLSSVGSVLSLSNPKATKRVTVPLEVRRREVLHFVLLQERIHLHARLETKEPAKLRGCEGREINMLRAPDSPALLGASPSTWI